MSKIQNKNLKLGKTPSINKVYDLLDDLLKECKTPDDIVGQNGLLKELTKALIERAMRQELTHHLGYQRHERSEAQEKSTNSRNGFSQKSLRTEHGELSLEVPRDRESSFAPQIVPKNQRSFKDFDEKIISMYARGMSVRDIQGHLEEIYGVDVSPDLISTVTDAISEEVQEWQNRPLDAVYPILYLDAIFVKIREGGRVINKAVYLALGVNLEGHKEILGLWIEQTEGAKFWLKILHELKQRGVKDILIACVDGLTGFQEAIQTEFPKTEVQLCIVHLMRNSLKYVFYKDRKDVAKDLKAIYRVANEQEAKKELENFKSKWDKRYPMISKIWDRNWERVIPFLSYPEEIRKAIYTTNAIESLNAGIRKVIKTRKSFPTDEAAMKLIYLAVNNASKKWTMPIRNWSYALQHFSILFDGRLELN